MSAVYALVRLPTGGGAMHMGYRDTEDEAKEWSNEENRLAERYELPWTAYYRSVAQ